MDYVLRGANFDFIVDRGAWFNTSMRFCSPESGFDSGLSFRFILKKK